MPEGATLSTLPSLMKALIVDSVKEISTLVSGSSLTCAPFLKYASSSDPRDVAAVLLDQRVCACITGWPLIVATPLRATKAVGWSLIAVEPATGNESQRIVEITNRVIAGLDDRPGNFAPEDNFKSLISMRKPQA